MAKDHSSRNTTVVLEGFKPVDPSLPDRRMIDLTGRTFGKLTVVKYAGRRHIKNGTQMVWICRCACGKLTLSTSPGLTGGTHGSCGCTVSKKNWKRRTTNIRHHPLYTTWSGIVRRTNDSVAYILRGMCEGFMEIDHFASILGPKPSADHSVDRIDNDGGYWCGCCEECVAAGRTKNVRWATKEMQCNNKGNNNRLTYQGRTQTLAQWAKELRIDRARISTRLTLGWSVDDALETRKLGNGHSLNPIHHDSRVQQQCVDAYIAGASFTELAVTYHCDRHSIERLLKRFGVKLRSRSEWMKLGLATKRRRRQLRQRHLDFPS